MLTASFARALLLVATVLVAIGCPAVRCGFASGFGKYEAYNTQRSTNGSSSSSSGSTASTSTVDGTDARTTDKPKTFFGLGANRAPAHDTPSSLCQCSEFWFDGLDFWGP